MKLALLTRLRMRPEGVVSKKAMGDLSKLYSKESCKPVLAA